MEAVAARLGTDACSDTREADHIYRRCIDYPLTALRSFNRHLASRPLTNPELTLFLASMAAFNQHTIAGIAILAGRLSDELLPHAPEHGHEVGAYVLDAAVDEYGLRETRDHVELARRFAAHLGVPPSAVGDRDNACASAIALGDALLGWYRNRPTAFSLGVHTASEVTSVEEFMSWHDIFLTFPEYRMSRDLPEFEYMRAHYVHEPSHIDHARICVAKYLDVLPANGALLQEGAETYLALYQRMFHELDTLIFK
jgi:Iron-containing redox enzyme